MSVARLNSLKLANFRVKYKTRGKWRTAPRGERSIAVPKSATEIRLEYKPAKNWLRVKTIKGKSKGKRYFGAKRVMKMLRTPDKVRRKYKTVYEDISAKLDGPWQLRPRSQRALPQWAKGYIYFNTPADLKAEWTQIAIWYAIEAEGFSDGAQAEGEDGEPEKVYYVDATYLEVEKQALRDSMLTGFHDVIAPRILGPDGEVEAHNKDKFNKFEWRAHYELLGVEGVNYEVSGKGRIRRKRQGAKSGDKV